MLERLRNVLAALRPPRGPGVDHWLGRLSGDDALDRWEAAEALGQHVGDTRVREALVAVLDDPHPFVRWQAALALSKSHDEGTFSLLQAAMASRNTRRRSAAADVLGRLGDKRATSTLCKALSSRNVEVRQSAAEALTRLADPAALSELEKALRDEDPIVRRAVVNALGVIGGAETVSTLLVMLQDESPLVRASTVGALGRLDAPGSAGPVRQALQDTDLGVRLQAIRSLAKLGSARDLAALETGIDDETKVFGTTIAEATHTAIESIRQRQRSEKATHQTSPPKSE
jgi:HEAT repeat protein